MEVHALHSYPLKYVLAGQPHCPLPAGDTDDGTQANVHGRHCETSEPPMADKKVFGGHDKHTVALATLE
jgi:hypothetical protein